MPEPSRVEPQECDQQHGLKMHIEPCTVEADEMAQAAAQETVIAVPQAQDELAMNLSPVSDNCNLTVSESMASGPSLQMKVEALDGFMKAVHAQYMEDPIFRRILENPSTHKAFMLHDGFLYTKNCQQEPMLCLPVGMIGKCTLSQVTVDLVHMTVGHFSVQKMSEYTRCWFWWPKMGCNIEKYCLSCQRCQASKPCDHLIAGLLHKLPILLILWIAIAMDFIGPFLWSNGYNYLWVIMCHLTSMVHLIPICTTDMAADLAGTFLKEIVHLHGLPQSIVSDRDPKFTLAFWQELHQMMGAHLLMSTAFHPQMDGMTEGTIHLISQVLCTIVSPDQLDWIDKIPITEFALNSSVSATTGFTPFELNYGYLPCTMVGIQTDTQYEGVCMFAEHTCDNLLIAHDPILTACVNQMHYANQHCQEEPNIKEETLVFLSMQNLSFPKGCACKLILKFIGPYHVEVAHPEMSTYMLDLPEDLQKCKINPMFHISLLRWHELNNDILFLHCNSRVYYNVGAPEEKEWYVEEIVGHRWVDNKLKLQVQWTHDDESWESYAEC